MDNYFREGRIESIASVDKNEKQREGKSLSELQKRQHPADKGHTIEHTSQKNTLSPILHPLSILLAANTGISMRD